MSIPIPAEMLAAAPRACVTVRPDMRVRVIDPRWRRETERRLMLEALLPPIEPEPEPEPENEAESEDEVPAEVMGPPPFVAPAQRVILEVCIRHGVTRSELRSPTPVRKVTRARFEAAHRLRDLGLSFPRIARQLGWRDHTTAIYAADQGKLIAQQEHSA